MDKKPAVEYVQRDYRVRHEARDLRYFQVSIKETDLAIGVDKASYTDRLSVLCKEEILRLRAELENYISIHPEFRTSFKPLPLIPGAPAIASIMSGAAFCAGVGPMAAVAGAIAQAVGEKIKSEVQEVIIENGGDIYLNSQCDRLISVFAGQSIFSHKIALRVRAKQSPIGICTSSGTVGPSISLGQADAVVVLSPHTSLADAAATGAANLVQDTNDLMKAVNFVKAINGVTGVLAIKDDKMAAWGNIEVVGI
ncbi:Uncharacterised protein family UPF0280 [Syntrophomonas zehnderi OL-4]|uniref:Uncharacterized protein family UPF0280 n=1 Tax=Syntrophomonas zehnderi OL-4 TaxID=690567 RepID=A0A0E4GD08_9FIRM|nr:UPF0280 family protein [Syntrophomonas zehnderi]CFX94953.1 Uncharacterised protein family UPF0280 [Syntrophomonas zehnderi OL-4]